MAIRKYCAKKSKLINSFDPSSPLVRRVMAMDFSIPFSSNGDKETMNIDKCFNCNEKPVFISDEDDIGYKFNLVHRTSGCPHHSYVHDDSKNDCIKYWNESNERRKRGYL